MPTPASWYRRAADILLDERNKRYLGMTDQPTDQPAIFDPATEATRGTPTGQRDQAANYKEPLSPAHFTPPASGPLDVERLERALNAHQSAMDDQRKKYHCGPTTCAHDLYARLTADAEGREG